MTCVVEDGSGRFPNHSNATAVARRRGIKGASDEGGGVPGSGCLVESVADGSPLAGRLQAGDVVLSLNGTDTVTFDDDQMGALLKTLEAPLSAEEAAAAAAAATAAAATAAAATAADAGGDGGGTGVKCAAAELARVMMISSTRRLLAVVANGGLGTIRMRVNNKNAIIIVRSAAARVGPSVLVG